MGRAFYFPSLKESACCYHHCIEAYIYTLHASFRNHSFLIAGLPRVALEGGTAPKLRLWCFFWPCLLLSTDSVGRHSLANEHQEMLDLQLVPSVCVCICVNARACRRERIGVCACVSLTLSLFVTLCVCVCVCLSVCLCLYVFVRPLTGRPLGIQQAGART